MRSQRADVGSGTVWVLLATTLVWLTGTWFVTLAGVAGTRAGAGAAADLAALAGAARADDGASVVCAAVEQVAAANRAVVRTCALDEDSAAVTVVVEVRGSGVLAHAPPAIGRARAGPSAAD